MTFRISCQKVSLLDNALRLILAAQELFKRFAADDTFIPREEDALLFDQLEKTLRDTVHEAWLAEGRMICRQARMGKGKGYRTP